MVKNTTINGIEFKQLPNGDYAITRDGFNFGTARKSGLGFTYGGLLDQSLEQIAAQLQPSILGLPIETTDSFDSLLDDSDCE